MKSILRTVGSWLAAALILLIRFTCRIRVHNDPRPELRANSTHYVFCILHAHQIAAAVGREDGTAAMVSRSGDGQLLMPGFWALRIKVIRGSNRTRTEDKGGRAALKELVAHVKGGLPAIMAVDGPNGPRNHVRKGIAVLSRQSDAAVLNVAVIPSRRWILSRTWDRLQIPAPFFPIDAYFAEPLRPEPGESAEQYRRRIEASLNELERTTDPDEAPEPDDATVELQSRAAAHRPLGHRRRSSERLERKSGSAVE